MTLRFRFSTSDMITTAGIAMRPVEINDIGGTFERVGQPGITEAFSHQELAEMMRRPDTTYFAGYFDRATQEMRQNKPVEVISELPEQIGRLVIWRKAVCDAFLTLEAKDQIKRTQDSYDSARPRLAAETQRLVGEGFLSYDDLSVIEPEDLMEMGGLSEEAVDAIVTEAERRAAIAEEAAADQRRRQREQEQIEAAAAAAAEENAASDEGAEPEGAEAEEAAATEGGEDAGDAAEAPAGE